MWAAVEMQRIDLKESDWRSSIAKAKAMDWLIRHRVAGKSSVEVDNYVEKLCTHSCEVERHPGPTLCQKFEFQRRSRLHRLQQPSVS
jgi:hypothetical protein